MLILNGTDVSEIKLDAAPIHEHEDTPEDIVGMLHYMNGVRDMVVAWDDIVKESHEVGRVAAFDQFAAMIEELRPHLDSLDG